MTTTVTEKMLAKVASGEKFDADEVVRDAELMEAADTYVRNYVGTFEFMVDLKKSLKRGLTPGQMKGALNVWLAEFRRNVEDAKPKPVVDTAKIVTFFHAVEGIKWPKVRLMVDDERITIKLKTQGKWKGHVEVTGADEWNEKFYSMAPHWYGRIDEDGNVTRGRGWTKVESMIAAFADDPAGTAAAYGKLTGACSFCNLPLTDARSLAVGYGPICAGHYKLPWGKDKFDVNEALAEVA